MLPVFPIGKTCVYLFLRDNLCLQYLSSVAATAGTNKAASSSTTLNTRKLDEDTENLARKLKQHFFTT